MLTPILAAALLALSGSPTGLSGHTLQGPQVELWTDRSDATVYHRGDRVRVYFRTDTDAYVTILRVDTDGRVRVLFPEEPWDDNFARGGRAYEVRPGDERYAFYVDEYPGQGYVFAIATLDPYDYRGIVRGDHWDYAVIGNNGRLTGDPYVAVQDLVDLIVPANYDAYGYDVATYYVEQYYDYPRFLCYDCHSYVAYPYWNPYQDACVRFRVVVYDDPYYYAARVYPANRVVYRRIARVEPRYVFKDRTTTDPYVVRVRQRPTQPDARRGDERGITGRDLGGVGTIPAPGIRQPAGRAPTGRVSDQPAVPSGAATRPPELTGPPGVREREPTPLVPDQRPTSQPDLEPRRIPEGQAAPTTTDRPRPPGAVTAPREEPRTLVPRERARQEDQERPTLERREPPERPSTPAARPEPQRPATQARPPAAQPREPVRRPEPPQKKPEASPRRKPGG
jgi:hypothetical protein